MPSKKKPKAPPADPERPPLRDGSPAEGESDEGGRRGPRTGPDRPRRRGAAPPRDAPPAPLALRRRLPPDRRPAGRQPVRRHQADRRGPDRRQDDRPGHPAPSRRRRAGAGRPLPDRLRRVGPEDAQVPRRLDADRLPGALPRPADRGRPDRALPRRAGSSRCEDIIEEGVELDALVHHVSTPLPADGRAEPAGARGAAGRRDEHAGARPPGRPARLQPAVLDRGEAATARRAQRPRPPGEARPVPLAPARRPGALEQDPGAGRLGDHQGPARPFPPPADQGDPGRAGRGGGGEPRARRALEEAGEGQAPGRGPGRGRARDRAALGDAPELGRVLDRPDLPRLAGGPPLEQVEPRPPRPAPGAEGPRRRPLRPGEDQGADPRIPGRPQAQEGHEGADPLPRRPPRHGQDLAGQEHRQGPGARVRPDQPGGRPRRGRDPRAPPDLRRRDARPDHPGDPQGGDQQPGLHARRGRQARRRLPRRPLRRAPGGARPRAERRPSATITSTSTSTSRR